MAAALVSPLAVSPPNPTKTLIPSSSLSVSENALSAGRRRLSFGNKKNLRQSRPPSLLSSDSRHAFPARPPRSVSGQNLSAVPSGTRSYEFCDGDAEVELRLDIGAIGIQNPCDIFVDADETSLLIRVKASGALVTLMDARRLFDKIKPGETIWYIDEDQLVVSMKKYDTELKWPDVMESWESLTSGVTQLLKGTSIYIVGDSTEINQKVARNLAVGLGYTPLNTSELLERYAQQPIDSWVILEGADSVAEAEGVVLESLSSHARAVVATLGGKHGAALRHDKWRHLHAGFTVWLSESEAADEAAARAEAQRLIQRGNLAYTNADVVVKLGGWHLDHSQVVAQACLSALKQLILSDKQLTEKKSLYIRLGCRGDWPNIKPPGWDPSSGVHPSPKA